MRKSIEVPLAATLPSLARLLRKQGVPGDSPGAPKIKKLSQQALAMYREVADPIGLVASVTRSSFARILADEGNNAAEYPLARIYPQASSLALFAVTVGSRLTERIAHLFSAHEYALAYLLDLVASEAVDQAAAFIEHDYHQNYCLEKPAATLRYSPGYCGWHISGQAKLFAKLRPQEIGISLTPSYLMQPLKSISGVLVSGAQAIHIFANDYSFCQDCRDCTCRWRIQSLLKK